jgi:hypothetical protein
MKSQANTETYQARQPYPARAASGQVLADERPEMAMLRRLQSMADNGPQVRQHKALAEGVRRGQVVQREVYMRGQFNEPEPEVTEDVDTLRQLDEWEWLQQGMQMFEAVASDYLDHIDAMPNVVLTFSTSTDIGAIGATTIKVVDPTGRVRTTVAGADNSATIAEWSRWLGNPATRVGIVVQLNPRELHNAAQVAHTLNHEVFLHAIGLFDVIKDLKNIPDDAARADAAEVTLTQPDRDHEDFVSGTRKYLVENQRRMIANAARGGDLALARDLIADYRADWHFQRTALLQARAGNAWAGEEALRAYALGVIAQYQDDPDRDAQNEVDFMRETLALLDYTFEDHLDDVSRRYRMDLDPPEAYPPAAAAQVGAEPSEE